ncbi:MAG: Succinyl-diaminopimelate desuccinylase [Phycisphaerae bacterium]|nr:Succinyl-diaminopimelate desuccinylase [Phycisphaerae bacterium]
MSIETTIAYLREHAGENLGRLRELLRVPSVSTDPGRAADCRRAAEFLVDYMRGMGLSAEVAETAGHPSAVGRWEQAGPDAPTILLYGHYDVQPAEPLELWQVDPFAGEVRDIDAEGRRVPGGVLIARGAADNKGQHMAMLAGVEAHLATAGRLPVNLKAVIEGEEEIGSRHLPAMIEARKADLACDAVLLADSYTHPAGAPAICYSARGLTYATITLSGPSQDIHSGVYGGVVTNPANALARLLAGLHDARGRVTLAGFYDGVPEVTAQQMAEIEALGITESDLAGEAGVERFAGGEQGVHFLVRRWFRPTCDVNGLSGGYQGPGSKTIIPASAMAKVSCRLVGAQDPARVSAALEAYMQANCPVGLKATVAHEAGARPYLADRSQPAFGAMADAIHAVTGRDASWIGGGGTLPILAEFKRILGAESVFIGVARADSHLHGPNEQCNVADLQAGAEVSARFWERLGGGGK